MRKSPWLLAGLAALAVAGGAGILIAQTPKPLGLPPSPLSAPPAKAAPELGVPATAEPTEKIAEISSDNAEVPVPDPPDGTLLMDLEDDFTPDFATAVINVMTPVTVTDENGNFVSGLEPYEFQLLDDGVPQVITQDLAVHPISLVVAIQSTATARQILPAVKQVAPLFDSLVIGETGEMAVIAYDHRIQKMTNFTSDPNQIRAAFDKIKPGSRDGHLDDAAMEGILMLRNRGSQRKKILLLIGETRDTGSRVTPRDVLTMAEFNDIEIYSVNMSHWLNQFANQAEPNRPNPVPVEGRMALPMGNLETPTTVRQTNMGNYTPIFNEIFQAVKGLFVPNPMEVYTTYTGGREHGFVSLSGLEDSITQIGEEIHGQYLLSFTPSNRKGGYHELEVRVLTSPNLRVRARRGYWIAGPDNSAPRPGAPR